MNIHEKNATAVPSGQRCAKKQPDRNQPRFQSAAATSVFATLLPELQRAVAEENYKTPTPIQAQAIPHLLKGSDLIGCAQTGTGKTAAFILPILQYLALHKRQAARNRVRVLILAPTRELAAQIDVSSATYGRQDRKSVV